MQNPTVDPFGIVGQVLDTQFRVDRLVGEGGFSAVYRGHHLGLDEPIAVKCLKLPPSLSPPIVDQFLKRFRDESRILYRLSQGNLNIVRSMAGGTWQSPVTGILVPFMVLEWLEGRSLVNEFTIRRTVGNQGRSLAEVVKIFGPAADGLGYAHSQGVIHRDLNPGNLFLAATREGPKMKVLDFGVAKILDDSTLNIERTHTVGQIRIFAPAYGAPEQFDDGIGPIGASSDVYAFALILLEALRDRTVNDGQHLGEFAQRATDPRNRPTPRSLGIECSDEVEQIFTRATKLDPRERWQTVGELWNALSMATSAASQQRHVQAALETPPLVMPAQGVRSTKTGMAPPPDRPAKTPGTSRMDKTMPLGTALPHLNLPRPPGAGVASPRVPPPPESPEVPRLNSDIDDDVATQINAPVPAAILAAGAEHEEEVTRVRAPEPDMLKGLADMQPQGFGGAQTMTQLSRGNSPRPAAGAPPEALPAPIPAAGTPAMDRPPPKAAPFAGTLMMQQGMPLPPVPQQPQHGAGGVSNNPPPPSPHAHTMPLQGPHPLGLQQPQNQGGPPPAAGMTPQQMQYPPQQQMPPQQMQGPPPGHPMHPGGYPQQPMQGGPQQPMQGPPQGYQQQPHPSQMMGGGVQAQPQNLGQSMYDGEAPASVAGVPKKKSGMLVAVLIAGSLLLVGVVAIVVVVVMGKGDQKTPPVPSATASLAATTPPSPSPTPDPTPAPTPAPTPDPTPAPTPDTPPTPDTAPAPSPAPVNPTPGPAPGPAPLPGPAPAPAPSPVAAKDAGAPAANSDAFSEPTARQRLASANSVLVFCKKSGGVTGPGSASVTFAPDGSVAEVVMNPPYAATSTGDCVSGQFKRVKTNSFKGSPQTVRHTFEIPK